MPWNTDLQNNNQTLNNSYTPGGYEKTNVRKLLLLVAGVFFAIALIILIVQLLPESQQSKYTKSATAAARKQIPDAQVKDVKVSGAYAIATVSDPSSKSQSNAGNVTIFRVNKDGSMIQIATGSYFSPIDLLGLGIPLATQAKLAGSSLAEVKQNLANQCGYSEGVIGYSGFNGSYNPGGWQIDSATLSGLEQKLSNAINSQNNNAKPDMKVICVNAIQKNSSSATNTTTYISTFTLQVQFITGGGTLTTHTITFSVGPHYYHNYTLDGQVI